MCIFQHQPPGLEALEQKGDYRPGGGLASLSSGPGVSRWPLFFQVASKPTDLLLPGVAS